MTRKSSASRSTMAAFAPRRCERAACRTSSRLRAIVLAAGGFEANLEWLREAWGDAARNFLIRGTPYNTGTVLKAMLGAGAAPDRRSARMPRRRDRRPRAEVRRRHRHAARLRSARHRRQPRRRAVLRRGRGFLAEALRDLGQARRAATRRDRLFDHRRQSARPLHAVGVSADRSRVAARARRASSACPRSGWRRPLRRSIAPCSRARSITRHSTTAAPPGSRPASRTGRSASTPRPIAAIRCGPASRSPISACGSITRRACSGPTACRLRTSTRPVRSWPATYCAKGYVAGIGMTIGTVFGRIAGESAARHANE